MHIWHLTFWKIKKINEETFVILGMNEEWQEMKRINEL